MPTKRIFCACCRNMGHFRCGVESENRYVNVHLYCNVSNLKKMSKMCDVAPPGKISADAHGSQDNATSLFNVFPSYSLRLQQKIHFAAGISKGAYLYLDLKSLFLTQLN